MLDNWQSGGREFDPRRIHDNLSVPLWFHMCFPLPEHQNQTNKYEYVCRQLSSAASGIGIVFIDTISVRSLHATEFSASNLNHIMGHTVIKLRFKFLQICTRVATLADNVWPCDLGEKDTTENGRQ